MRTYQGTGIVTIPDMPDLKGTFKLEFENSGKALLYLTSEMSDEALKLSTMPFGPAKFSGISNSPYYEVEIEKIYLTNYDLSEVVRLTFSVFHTIKITYLDLQGDKNAELRFGISNFVFYGTEKIKIGVTSLYGKTSWNLSGRDVTLEQLPGFEKIIKHLIECKDMSVTSELKITCVYKDISQAVELSENLQNLFSVASGNYVKALYQDIYSEGQLFQTLLLPGKTYTFSNYPSLIDNSFFGNHEFKDFIDTTYQNYVSFRDNLGLSYFIEFFTISKMYSPLEVEYVLATTAFECLESYFRTWQGLPNIRNDLKRKISRMCSHFRFTTTEAELEPYRNCRNSLTHEGKFPAGSDSVESTMALRNLIDRFVLTILGYKNKPYYNVVKRTKDMVP